LNLFGLSPGELVLIMMIAMVVIGPEKLPETAASIGKWVREFRRVTTELTQQFSDENPFTEIQRAFSLTELTNSINAPFTTTEPIAAIAPTPAPPPDTVPVTASPQVTSAPTPIRSYYFDQPAVYLPVEDTWTHSGLDDTLERYGVWRKPITTDETIDDWAHGVPFHIEPPAMIETVSDDLASAEPVETDSVTPNGDTSFLDDVEARIHPTMSVAGEPAPSEPVAVGAASSADRSVT
jgi:sec-independent protein translocase protein TatB